MAAIFSLASFLTEIQPEVEYNVSIASPIPYILSFRSTF